MAPLEILPLAEREEMVKQLSRRYRVDPCRRDDFRQEAHLHIAHAISRLQLDVSKGNARQYAYRIAHIQLGRWLMFQASPLSGGRNGDRRRKILAETKIVGDACLAFLPCALEEAPEGLLLRRERQARARDALRRLARRKRPEGRLRAALGQLLAMGNPQGRKLVHAVRKPEERLRREMAQLLYEIRMSHELAEIARAA